MEDILKDYKEKIYLTADMVGIVKENYKEQCFKDTVLFKVERGDLPEKFLSESYDKIKSFFIDDKFVIVNTPIVKYKNNSYMVDEIVDIDTIEVSIKNNCIVLMYAPIIIDSVLKYIVKIIN